MTMLPESSPVGEAVTITSEELLRAAVIVRDQADALAIIGDIAESDRLYSLAEGLRKVSSRAAFQALIRPIGIDRDALLGWARDRVLLDRTAGAAPAWRRLIEEIESGRFDLLTTTERTTR